MTTVVLIQSNYGSYPTYDTSRVVRVPALSAYIRVYVYFYVIRPLAFIIQDTAPSYLL